MELNTKTRLIPIPKWAQYHDWPSANALRFYIANRNNNGFDVAIKRIGRRVLIDENAFFTWVEKQNREAK